MIAYRPIPQFTRTTETTRVRECAECQTRITWGRARREVRATPKSLDVRFCHEDC
jgi:hypothetical protein